MEVITTEPNPTHCAQLLREKCVCVCQCVSVCVCTAERERGEALIPAEDGRYVKTR